MLLGNTPEMLRAMAAAGLGGYVLCGINTTRRGEASSPTSAERTASSCSPTRSTCRCWRGWTSAGVTVIDVTAPDWAAGSPRRPR